MFKKVEDNEPEEILDDDMEEDPILSGFGGFFSDGNISSGHDSSNTEQGLEDKKRFDKKRNVEDINEGKEEISGK